MFVQFRRRADIQVRLAVEAVGRANGREGAKNLRRRADLDVQVLRLRILQRLVAVVGRAVRNLGRQQGGAPVVAGPGLKIGVKISIRSSDA